MKKLGKIIAENLLYIIFIPIVLLIVEIIFELNISLDLIKYLFFGCVGIYVLILISAILYLIFDKNKTPKKKKL